jgi:hypothetical protein
MSHHFATVAVHESTKNGLIFYIIQIDLTRMPIKCGRCEKKVTDLEPYSTVLTQHGYYHANNLNGLSSDVYCSNCRNFLSETVITCQFGKCPYSLRNESVVYGKHTRTRLYLYDIIDMYLASGLPTLVPPIICRYCHFDK